MDLLEFTYKKADGSKSERVVVTTMSVVNTNLFGIDVTEISDDPSQLSSFIEEYSSMVERHKEELDLLLRSHDLNHKYRQFKRDGITFNEVTKL